MNNNNLPPKFPTKAFIFFGVLWIINVLMYFNIITLVASEGLAIFGEIAMFGWLFSRYGFKSVFRKLNNRKNNKGFKNRFLLQFFGDLVPFLSLIPWDLWFIYKEYQSELAEFNQKVRDI